MERVSLRWAEHGLLGLIQRRKAGPGIGKRLECFSGIEINHDITYHIGRTHGNIIFRPFQLTSMILGGIHQRSMIVRIQIESLCIYCYMLDLK